MINLMKALEIYDNLSLAYDKCAARETACKFFLHQKPYAERLAEDKSSFNALWLTLPEEVREEDSDAFLNKYFKFSDYPAASREMFISKFQDMSAKTADPATAANFHR